MKVGGGDESTHIFLDLKINLRQVAMKYGFKVVLYVTIPLGYGGFGMDSHLEFIL
jgi:predicted histidine transporter YuiF (NhaC family)